MKLKDLRKELMNAVIDRLRERGPQTFEQVLAAMPDVYPIGLGTARQLLISHLNELGDRNYVTVFGAGYKNPGGSNATYSLHDRMFDARGMYIGQTLFDPEWPDTWKRR